MKDQITVTQDEVLRLTVLAQKKLAHAAILLGAGNMDDYVKNLSAAADYLNRAVLIATIIYRREDL